jgi:AbrB family looped-hinge helix DNA binding protein
MVVGAVVSSKGQVTLPKALRDALQIEEGDRIFFRIDIDHVVIEKPKNFLDLAGTIEVPAHLRNLTWDEIVSRAYSSENDQ